MIKIKEVIIPIYFGTLVIIVTDNWEEVNTIYDKTDIDGALYEGVFFEVKNKDEYVVAIKRTDWSVIAHEAVHVVNAIFLNCGVILNRKNDEPQAYLTGWVVNEIDKFLKELL